MKSSNSCDVAYWHESDMPVLSPQQALTLACYQEALAENAVCFQNLLELNRKRQLNFRHKLMEDYLCIVFQQLSPY